MDAILSDRSDEDLEVWVAEVVFTATSRNVVGFGNSLGEVRSEGRGLAVGIGVQQEVYTVATG